jgi:phage portal protein BeeE
LKAETRTDICGAFGVPPSIVGAKETASKATWKQHMVMFHHNTINPDARYFGGVLNQDLMPLMFDQPKFEFLPEKVEVLQEERTAKSERVVAEVEAGILNRFAAAEILGYEPHQVGEAPMDVTKEFSEKSEKRALRREIKKFMKKNPNLKTFEFRSQILSPDRILEIMEESKNGND